MHSQQLIEQIRNNLFTDPQKCIKTLSNKSFLNNLFQTHLEKLTAILEAALQKMSKQNKNISFNDAAGQTKTQQLNAQLIVCFYSIIIIKSSSKSIILSQQCPIYNQKLAIQTLNKIHKQTKQEDIKKIVAALLLKIPNFNAHKNIVKQLDPKFVSVKTLQKSFLSFRNQCPNLFQQKLNNYKDTNWGRFLSYKPFKLDDYKQIIKKLQDFGSDGKLDANILINIKDSLRTQYQFLMKRLQQIQKQQFFLYEFCQQFTQIFRTRLQFPKILSNQKYSTNDNSKGPSSKSLPNMNINELKLKILLESRNYLLKILIQMIKKLSSYWTRKIKWLYDFVIERIQVFGLEEMNVSAIQEPQVFIEKLKQLKLTIKLCHTYYLQFGDGLFPQQKLKSILFTQQYSFYKLIQSILYNEYEFVWQHENSRIVNYQKNRKVTQQTKTKQNLRTVVNVNSKSLNINPHYDLVLQKIISEITNKQGSSYHYLTELINYALKFIKSYYKNSQTYFYGGNLISMIQNCKNTQIIKQDTLDILKSIKANLYPNKKMVKQGLEFFCQEVFESYISKRRLLQVQAPKRNSSSFTIQKTTYLTIHQKFDNNDLNRQSAYSSKLKIQPSPKQETTKGAIRKTKSYDMVFQGWSQQNQQADAKSPGYVPIRNQQKKLGQDSQIFYSIKEETSMVDQTQKDRKQLKDDISIRQNLELANSKFQSIRENQSAAEGQEDFILTPQF